MVVQIGLIDAQGDSRLAEADQVLVVNEDPCRVIGIDHENQFGLGRDRLEHGVHIVLEILFPERNGDHLPAGQFRPRREELEGGRGDDELIAGLEEDPHHAIDDLRGAVAQADIVRSQVVELSQFGPQPQHAVGIAVPFGKDIRHRLDHLLGRGERVFIEHQATVIRLCPGLIQDGGVVFPCGEQPGHKPIF